MSFQSCGCQTGGFVVWSSLRARAKQSRLYAVASGLPLLTLAIDECRCVKHLGTRWMWPLRRSPRPRHATRSRRPHRRHRARSRHGRRDAKRTPFRGDGREGGLSVEVKAIQLSNCKRGLHIGHSHHHRPSGVAGQIDESPVRKERPKVVVQGVRYNAYAADMSARNQRRSQSELQ